MGLHERLRYGRATYMPKRIGTIDVYNLLPQTNCRKCGEATCMAFAAKLLERSVKIQDCPPLFEEQNKEKLNSLKKLLAPPVREVVIGVGDKAVKIGGEEVLYRHELAFFNKTALAVTVHDLMTEDQLIKRVKEIESFQVTRLAHPIGLDLIAVRSVSNDPTHYGEVVEKITKATDMPLILCSFNPDALDGALKVAGKRRPLIYAATEENWREVGKLALQYDAPVAVVAPYDLNTLKSVVRGLREMGLQELVLDPGVNPDGGFQETLSRYIAIRRAAIERGDPDFGFPLLSVPAATWLKPESDPTMTAFKEFTLASALIVKYADLEILHTLETWGLLPLLTLRENIYTDPRKPVAVSPGLREIGKPDWNAPLLVTANFALTYFTVESDLQSSGVNCHLIVIDTGGLGVEVAVAGRQFTAEKIAEMLKTSNVEGKIRHRRLLIPGLAARLKGDIEDATNWDVLVGPKDSADVKTFLDKQWGKEGTTT
ncbi:MAG: acetyl-CoA decarbonylase/synthase complex subunit gamma [Candidatus Bathyarchaeia archaeon]